MQSSQLTTLRAVAAGLAAAALVVWAAHLAGPPSLLVSTVAAILAVAATRDPIRAMCRRVAIDDQATTPWWAVAAVAAVPAALAAAKYGDHSHLIVVLPAIVSAAWAAWIDLRSKRIPSRLLYIATGTVFVLSAAIDLPAQGLRSWASTLAIAAAGTALLLLAAIVTAGRAVGAADVRLMPILGLVAGYEGWPTLWSMFIFAVFAMFPLAVISVVRRRRDPESATAALPFAPGLLIGLVLALAVTT